MWQCKSVELRKKFDIQSVQPEGEQIKHPGKVVEQRAHMLIVVI